MDIKKGGFAEILQKKNWVKKPNDFFTQ